MKKRSMYVILVTILFCLGGLSKAAHLVVREKIEYGKTGKIPAKISHSFASDLNSFSYSKISDNEELDKKYILVKVSLK